jgi:hypothetical protein
MKQHFKGLKPAERRKIVNNMDTTPMGHDCIGVELISLLLTGKIHSNFENWSAGPLGLGILSNRRGEVGQALMRPEKPVWVCRGHTCYSLLMMDHTNDGQDLDENTPVTDSDKNKEKTNKQEPVRRPKAAPCMKMSQCSSHSRSRDLMEASNFAKMDQPRYVANLLHWNCWYGQRHKSGIRLITAPAAEWKPPRPSKILSRYREAPDAKHAVSLTCERKTVKQQLLERRNSGTSLSATSDVQQASEAELLSKDMMTADEEERLLKQIRAHPDDPTFYPKNYRMWRFDMGESKEDSNACLSSKPRGDRWTSYFALSKEEQLLVEKKMGPKIMPILFTRWPGATIDKFEPNGKDPAPVV